jgi:hypothetical protein
MTTTSLPWLVAAAGGSRENRPADDRTSNGNFATARAKARYEDGMSRKYGKAADKSVDSAVHGKEEVPVSTQQVRRAEKRRQHWIVEVM